MIVVKTREEVISYLASLKGSRGFVPTMGALHQGHLSLVKESKRRTGHTVVSIFVNPAQFNDSSDFEKYPRNREHDLEMLSGILQESDLVYIPEPNDIYRAGHEDATVELGNLEMVMEGKFRPGHFRGVIKVVNILFNITRPSMAFFGEKDFQQLAVVRKMASQLHPGVEIEGCPILREPNGLAMSSRNKRLSNDIRKRASIIYRTLSDYSSPGANETVESVKEAVIATINREKGFRTEYFDIVDSITLESIRRFSREGQETGWQGCIAVWAEDVRLIDNIRFSFPF